MMIILQCLNYLGFCIPSIHSTILTWRKAALVSHNLNLALLFYRVLMKQLTCLVYRYSPDMGGSQFTSLRCTIDSAQPNPASTLHFYTE
jgi:hypothetical protein